MLPAAMPSPRRDVVLVLDFGSQYTQLIARRVRECGVYCEIHPYHLPLDRIQHLAPRALTLSGGPASVFGDGAPRVSRAVLELDLPILGICYGMQLLALELGGRVERGTEGEYGPATVRIECTGPRGSPPGIFER